MTGITTCQQITPTPVQVLDRTNHCMAVCECVCVCVRD